MQFIWTPFSKHYDSSSEIYTHAFLNRYVWPKGFNLDKISGRDVKINSNTVQKRASEFIDYVKNQMQPVYRGKQLMILMGDDFNYQNADFNYKQLDLLIDNINQYYPGY